MVNWNKPVQPATTIYISPQLRRFLLRKTVDADELMRDWLERIQAHVEIVVKANTNSGVTDGFRTGEMGLLGKIVANAIYEITDANRDADLIEYTVLIGFRHEYIDAEKMFPLVLERESK